MPWVWVMAFNTINILIPYLLIYNHGLIFSLAADDAANLTSLADKRVAAGFISIDCGMVGDPQYSKDNGVYYTSDIGFINTGTNMDVQVDYQSSHWPMYNTVRSFPDGSRNCYTLKPLQGKNTHYLIRARFHYGNYDGLNRKPRFDLYIGVNYWATVKFISVENKPFYEIIYTSPVDLIYVCLVNTGSGTPFISGLELRPLNNSIYKSPKGALAFYLRLDAGISVTDTDPLKGHYSSIKDDPYDRPWALANKLWASWDSLSSNASMNFSFTDAYELPPSVLKTAAIPEHGGDSLMFDWNYSSITGSYQVYWHFAEILKLGINDSREFSISMSGNFESGKISPEYGRPITVVSPVTQFDESQLKFNIMKTSNSTLPPILNALEIYKVLDLPASATYQKDVDAILNVKMNYTVPKDWQGDPCLPHAPWDGLNCSNSVDNHPPRIISLNLAHSGLTGDIPHSLSALTSLVYLNLSHNSLTGVIPDFLAELPSLRTIDLTSNNLVGRVPIALSKKKEDGSLNLSLEDNPGLCSSNSCKKKNPKKIAVILAATVSLIFIFVAIGVYYKYKQKKPASFIKQPSKLKIRGFTYSEVNHMTNNFQTIIGKGGSGVVYQGYLQDGTPVAVKMLSPSSTVSLKLFHTECELLTRFHHRNLVSLIGCCEEGTTMALIYEYLANGNLQQYLLDVEKNVKVLSWKKRLQIARDAAQDTIAHVD
ncbi:probable LRR receptor-like serine/threonine-protein kinase At1g05700 isoform X2 [Chenopodium quinoa]|uniref:probable LRR receptor-like serine/threonine-protein kinase At1g05700 isoform X2 n=1 Tax=Chenopodium quinoa TaxID=63459 RepID=UPI000B77BE59|nr:probable LRR receptor-like serine/threonine-protein kinase At1g05700 isoform X2 [Chenopodium quinoa]